MMKFIRGFLIGVQFFTAIPISKQFPMDEDHLKRTIQAFPLLGLGQGMIYSFLLYILIENTPFSHLAAAFLLWLVTIILTGGIHLDAWMDVSDAYFSYQDQAGRLEIMKDPRIGAFGVISVMILLSCRFLFIYEITLNPHLLTYVLIAIIPFLSKTIMGVLLLTVRPARAEGLGYLFQKAATAKALWLYPVYLLAAAILFPRAAILIVPATACYLFARLKVGKWFGGITGDVLGATVEGTELILWLTVWLLHYFVTV